MSVGILVLHLRSTYHAETSCSIGESSPDDSEKSLSAIVRVTRVVIHDAVKVCGIANRVHEVSTAVR